MDYRRSLFLVHLILGHIALGLILRLHSLI